MLIIGRIIQGLSAACIMPATIALMKAYFEGKDRQRALSFWSIGSWGGSGVVHLLVVPLQHIWDGDGFLSFPLFLPFLLCCLLKIHQKVKQKQQVTFKFDYSGLAIFIITMLALNVFITFGADLGWTSPITSFLAVVTIIGVIVFFKVEKRKEIVLIDFSLFKNKPYAGATFLTFC